MPVTRLNTLKAVAKAAVADPDLFRSSRSIDEAVNNMRKIPGIGEWTAQYIALRALREVDAFPASDIGLLRGARKIVGEPITSHNLLQWSELWRPWRAYAAQHLWAVDADHSGLST
jgi:AraC family transcriptional regulator of adaptative response / DNA-3-methyladenine glycosylase II